MQKPTRGAVPQGRLRRWRIAGGDIPSHSERKEQDRAKTAAAAAETDRQYGELSERLAAARSSTDFDEAKFKCEEVEARLRETYRRLSVLFIAKRSLEAAIAEWERKANLRYTAPLRACSRR